MQARYLLGRRRVQRVGDALQLPHCIVGVDDVVVGKLKESCCLNECFGKGLHGRRVMAQRLAHRWRPATDSRIVKLLCRASIRWSGLGIFKGRIILHARDSHPRDEESFQIGAHGFFAEIVCKVPELDEGKSCFVG